MVLGYTQVSWDNDSGQESLPFSAYKSWASLSDNEKAAAALLGYNEKSWDNESGLEAQPASGDKQWAELTTCGKDDHVSISHLPPSHVSFALLSTCVFAGA